MDLNQAERALVTGDSIALRRALFDVCSTDLHTIDELVKFTFSEDAVRPELGDAAVPFLVSIELAKRAALVRKRSGNPPLVPTHRVIGQGLDFLGELHEPGTWTPAQCLNLLVLGQTPPRRRAAVVGTMRDDGIYVIEWVAFYLSLGFDHVFIYTNDNADGSEHLLRRLAALGVITLIESETSGKVRPEVKAFNHAVNMLHELRDYEWVLFVDSDEYFVPGPNYHHAVGNVLDAVMRRYPDGRAGAIVYQWLWFNSAMVFERRPGPLIERFQYATPHWLTKSLVRLRDVLSMLRQHFPDLRPHRLIVDSAFDPLDPDNAWKAWPTQYSGGRINHYWPKSFEEFSLKKARGDSLTLAENEYARDFKLFFEWNGLETAETYHPIDPTFLMRVRDRIAQIRVLDGVAVCEQEVERGFRRLVARHDQAGGLRRVYEAVKP